MFSQANKLQDKLGKFNKSKALLPFDLLYYFSFIVVYSYFFVRTTLLYKEFLTDYSTQFILGLNYVGYFLFGYSIFTIIFVCNGIKDRIATTILLVFSVLYLYKRELDVDYKTIYITFLFVLCSRNKNPKVLLVSTYLIGWFQILLSFVLSRIGTIPAYVYAEGRHGFGSIYPTDLACHFVVLLITLCMIRKGKLKIYDYAWYIIVCVVNYFFMQAKVGLACVMLILVATAFYQYLLDRIQIPDAIKKIFSITMIVIYPFLAIASIILTKTFVDSEKSIWRHFKTLRYRLIFGNRLLSSHSLTLWGDYVKEVGNGGTPAYHSDYFFVDISYVRVFFFNGLFTLILVILIYTITQFIFVKRDMPYMAFLLAVFAIDCAVEHHIIQIAYGLIFMCLFLSDYMVFSNYKIRKYDNPFVTIPLSMKNKEHKKLVFFNQEKFKK